MFRLSLFVAVLQQWWAIVEIHRLFSRETGIVGTGPFSGSKYWRAVYVGNSNNITRNNRRGKEKRPTTKEWPEEELDDRSSSIFTLGSIFCCLFFVVV